MGDKRDSKLELNVCKIEWDREENNLRFHNSPGVDVFLKGECAGARQVLYKLIIEASENPIKELDFKRFFRVYDIFTKFDKGYIGRLIEEAQDEALIPIAQQKMKRRIRPL